MESTVPAFIPYTKCSGLALNPKYYYCDGKGRDYYITYDQYDIGNQFLDRPNSYSFNHLCFHDKKQPQHAFINNQDHYRTGRTKFKRYFGNGTGKDAFIIRNNGGHHSDERSLSSMIQEFEKNFRAAPDKSYKEELKKRKKEMMKNIHAIEMSKMLSKKRVQEQLYSSMRLSVPKYKKEAYPEDNSPKRSDLLKNSWQTKMGRSNSNFTSAPNLATIESVNKQNITQEKIENVGQLPKHPNFRIKNAWTKDLKRVQRSLYGSPSLDVPIEVNHRPRKIETLNIGPYA